MSLVDDDGRLLGHFNVIDVGVLLSVVVILAFAGHFLLMTGQQPGVSQSVAVTIEADVHPATADALDEVAADSPAVLSIEPVRGYYNATDRQRVQRVHVTAVVDVRRRNGALYRGEERLVIGRDTTFDVGRVVVSGTVVELQPVNRSQKEGR